VHTSEHNLSFIHHIRDHFPDPDQIYYTLHGKLWKHDRGHKPSGTGSRSDQSECVLRLFAGMKFCA